MQVTCVCAEDLTEFVQAATDAARRLEDSVAALRGQVLSDEDRRAEGQRCLDEAARLWGAARGLVEHLGLWLALRESRR